MHPTILRLLHYPIPDEIRCYYWAIALDVAQYHQKGYFSNLLKDQNRVPQRGISHINDDVKRIRDCPLEVQSYIGTILVCIW